MQTTRRCAHGPVSTINHHPSPQEQAFLWSWGWATGQAQKKACDSQTSRQSHRDERGDSIFMHYRTCQI